MSDFQSRREPGVRCSRLVRLRCHVAGKIMEQTIPTNALTRQIEAKRGAPVRSNHHKTKRPTKENIPIIAAALPKGESRCGSADQITAIEVTCNASSNPTITVKNARCDAMTLGFMEPNAKVSDGSQPPMTFDLSLSK